jgi:hypothetical protein
VGAYKFRTLKMPSYRRAKSRNSCAMFMVHELELTHKSEALTAYVLDAICQACVFLAVGFHPSKHAFAARHIIVSHHV